MATIDGPKYAGPLTIDLTDVKDHLVDLPPGATKGVRAEQPGIGDVLEELAKAIPTHGDAADIPPQAYQRVVAQTTLLAALRAHEMKLEKLLEICRETRAKTENDREDDLGVIAKAVQTTAARKKQPGIAAPFEKTIRYNSQIAEKAAQTRRKNAEAKSGEGGDGGDPPA